MGNADDMEKKTTTKQPKHYTESIAGIYVISVLASCNAEIFTYPLDLIKTRLQVQGEPDANGLKKIPYRGMTATVVGIIREEGFFKLWKGMMPAFYRHAIYGGSRIVFYDKLRQKFGENGKLPVWQAALCGAAAGGFAQWIANPTDVIKVQSQMEGKRIAMGLKPRFHTFGQALQQIYLRGGIKGLWAGSVPGVIRAAFVNIGDLATYDKVKHIIMDKTNLPDSPLLHFLASLAAGIVGTIVANPADVIKSRIMNQPIDDHGRGLLYKGPIDCFQQTVRNEGFLALYKGVIPLWIRLGPWALVFWMSFEQIRKILGGPGY